MPNVVLYGPSEAPFTAKVRGALALKKTPYRLVEPSSPEDYRRWSPETGLLPVIDVDGTRVHDSAAILDYLDQRFPDPPLSSSDPKLAVSQRRLERWVEESFTFYWRNYLQALVQRGESAALAEGKRGLGRRRASPAIEGLGREFTGRLDDLVNFLGDRPFFYADQPSRADLAVYSFLGSIREAAGDVIAGEVERRVPLRDHLARVRGWVTDGV